VLPPPPPDTTPIGGGTGPDGGFPMPTFDAGVIGAGGAIGGGGK
jgi:hypothetical protein